MAPSDQHSRIRDLVRLAVAFARELAAHAGRELMRVAVFVGLAAVLEGVGLVLIVPLLGIVIGPHGDGKLERAARLAFAQVGLETPFARLAFLLSIFSTLMILRAVVIRIRDVGLARLRIGFMEAKRGGIMDRLAAARWDQVVALRHTRVTHLMSEDIQRIGMTTHFMLQTATAAALLIVQVGLAFALSPPLALVALALLMLAGAALVPLLRRAGGLGAYVTAANLNLLDTTARFMGGLKLAISQNLQARFVGEFRATLGALADRQIANLKQNTYSRVALTTVTALAGAALVLIGYGWFALSPAILITILLVVGRMVAPAGQIQQSLQQLAFALPAFGAVRQLEAELESMGTAVPAASAVFPQGPVVFDAVRFRHRDDGRGVEALSVSIAPGEFIGVAGPSGAGKTTFADLLVGLYPPQSGTITVGGTALKGVALQGWREHLSYVAQDPFLFHDSIRRNLSWGAPTADVTQMWQALTLVGAEGLVRDMPQGLDAIVGERGTLMSGGERQRIALAGALLRRPRILVLDEATSAIDVASEHRILEGLAALTPRPTIVLIAHRRESLALCDRVVQFSDGRIAADG